MPADPGANHVQCERPAPSPETIAAVVVTHRPDPGVTDRLAAIVAQFAQVIVVDNHSEEDRLAALREFAAKRENILSSKMRKTSASPPRSTRVAGSPPSGGPPGL